MQKASDISYIAVSLFPACAGMNRHSCSGTAGAKTVPRMRGDEPLASAAGGLRGAVPRMRGDEPSVSNCNETKLSCSPHARG